MPTLTDSLRQRGFSEFEGYSQQIPQQAIDLMRLSHVEGPVQILEIGFNAGHSAELFLDSTPSAHLTSFDLGCHKYVSAAKEYIDTAYPGRHTLILGDSTLTLPKFRAENPGKTFDMFFIDGGHTYETAWADLKNCRALAKPGALVLMDDIIYTKEWMADYTLGPTQAWIHGIESGFVRALERREYCPTRGMSWGRFV